MPKLERKEFEEADYAMRRLTEEERLKVMSKFCAGCGVYLVNEDGSKDRCHCQNDE
jgi:hypothetical protein